MAFGTLGGVFLEVRFQDSCRLAPVVEDFRRLRTLHRKRNYSAQKIVLSHLYRSIRALIVSHFVHEDKSDFKIKTFLGDISWVINNKHSFHMPNQIFKTNHWDLYCGIIFHRWDALGHFRWLVNTGKHLWVVEVAFVVTDFVLFRKRICRTWLIKRRELPKREACLQSEWRHPPEAPLPLEEARISWRGNERLFRRRGQLGLKQSQLMQNRRQCQWGGRPVSSYRTRCTRYLINKSQDIDLCCSPWTKSPACEPTHSSWPWAP